MKLNADVGLFTKPSRFYFSRYSDIRGMCQEKETAVSLNSPEHALEIC
jgi:hypothetical protein